MDFVVPPRPIDGGRALLAARDLASRGQLAWEPVADQTAPTAAECVEALFVAHGAPLVLKSDNGSPFVGPDTRAVLDRWGVLNVLSPPLTPQYNGGVEVGNYWMKTRTRHQTAHRGRPEVWSGDDCHAARLQANTLARPWGPAGPTPSEVWTARPPITDDDRARFRARVAHYQREARLEHGLAPDAVLDRRRQASIDRIAIRRALVALGYLTIRRKPISHPLPPRPEA